MNHILYNISVIIILFGIILMIIYYSKNNYKEIIIEKPKPPKFEDNYDVRPSQLFNSMFNSNSTWDKYLEFDPQTTDYKNLYIK
jgi:hypothetical protein